jgi:NAD(P)-dependent dehydrogenase (short-subunit alcohol dehydrogenase family)
VSRAVVIGANRGIGLELCRVLAGRGDEVVAVCRRSSGELDRLPVRVEAGVDVTSDRDVADLAARLARIEIGLLIHSAGILRRQGLPELDFEGIRQQFEVNALGPLRVIAALLPNLGPGSKIALITSRMGSLGDNQSGSHYGYRMSKAALNMAGISLAIDLRARGIAVVILHPGFVRTDMTAQRGELDPARAAVGLVARIDELGLESSGSFLHQNGTPLPW